MCYRLECATCGKYTWGGCGKHLTTLYRSIDEGMHCMCRSWPGVVIPSQQRTATTTDQPSTSNNSHDNTNSQSS
ncbi:hypothetical protein MtrunA17_Chr5g0403091 [Medicago truncatula]|uniref:Uncharacterized protein n=1 Tax=Medicago truncatula TaxID=3880 RepID=G7K9H0_MEDTR|nr:hypothetical protein MTR_5g018610 [Medicago truncatula]RHN54107.1 hypothetical protein MtrunA17_Chr5g0403091 [Medicago truncatula]